MDTLNFKYKKPKASPELAEKKFQKYLNCLFDYDAGYEYDSQYAETIEIKIGITNDLTHIWRKKIIRDVSDRINANQEISYTKYPNIMKAVE